MNTHTNIIKQRAARRKRQPRHMQKIPILSHMGIFIFICAVGIAAEWGFLWLIFQTISLPAEKVISSA